MGWKSIRDEYAPDYLVTVNSDREIRIGTEFISDAIIVRPDGVITKRWSGIRGALAQAADRIEANPSRFTEFLEKEDKFEADIQVWTWEEGAIVEDHCEALGWPNVTHSGSLMYDNTHSTDRDEVLEWAKRSMQAGIDNLEDMLSAAQKTVDDLRSRLEERRSWLTALNNDTKTAP